MQTACPQKYVNDAYTTEKDFVVEVLTWAWFGNQPSVGFFFVAFTVPVIEGNLPYSLCLLANWVLMTSFPFANLAEVNIKAIS